MSNPNRPPEAIRDELLAHVEFDVPRPPHLEWDPDLGFLVEPAATNDTIVRVAGFTTPCKRRTNTPEYDDARDVYPIDTYADLPRSLQTIKHLSWGTGMRLYTDEQTARNGSNVKTGNALTGLYAVNLWREKILDIRDTQGGTAKHAARYGLKVLASAIIGTKATVDMVQHRYSGYAAVRMRRPEQGRMSMERAGISDIEDVEPGFLLLLSRNTRAKRLGHVISGNWL
ncbi:MAG TPA: hypothetical protein VLF59_00120 [Candidatus Saccharimonadales bacterium]|nr:hypothetical protein [Candidatus Saccharimonadales bacterium]